MRKNELKQNKTQAQKGIGAMNNILKFHYV